MERESEVDGEIESQTEGELDDEREGGARWRERERVREVN